MDAPGCETLPMSECSDPKIRLRCPTRCSQRLRSDNEIVNLSGNKIQWYDSNLLKTFFMILHPHNSPK